MDRREAQGTRPRPGRDRAEAVGPEGAERPVARERSEGVPRPDPPARGSAHLPDRTSAVPRGSHERHARLRPAGRASGRSEHHRDHVQRPRRDLHRAERAAREDGSWLRRRRAVPPGDRQDRLRRRAPCRRILADGRRALAERLTCERDHRAARPPGFGADDPEVRRGSIHGEGSGQLRNVLARVRARA